MYIPPPETDYRSGIDHFVSWCTPVNINGQHIESVHSYKYLGTTIEDKLRWDNNAMNLYKKGQQLNALHIDRNILFVFHDSFVESVMMFGLVCWWGNLSVKNREKLNRIYTMSCKITMLYTRYQSLYKSRKQQMATKILSDPTYFLHDHYDLPSPLWKEVQNANSKNPASP